MCASVALVALAACGGEGSIPDTLPPAETPPPTRLIVVANPTTTLVPIPVELINDCMDYVEFGVYTGNGLAISMWENAAQDLVSLALDCEYLGRQDLAALQELSRQWNEIEAFLNGASTSLAPSTTATS